MAADARAADLADLATLAVAAKAEQDAAQSAAATVAGLRTAGARSTTRVSARARKAPTEAVGATATTAPSTRKRKSEDGAVTGEAASADAPAKGARAKKPRAPAVDDAEPVAPAKPRSRAPKANGADADAASAMDVDADAPAEKAGKAPRARKEKRAAKANGAGADEDDGAAGAAVSSVPPGMPTNTTMPKEYHFEPVPAGCIKIVSYNVASLFAALSKGFKPYIVAENADIVCLQETKHKDDALPQNLLQGIMRETWSAPEVKKGYSGTAVLSKIKPLNVKKGIGVPRYDDEGRVITHEYANFFLVATYVPNSGQKLDRLGYRQEWNAALLEYLKTLDKAKPVIWTGDLNVSHQDIDLARPATNKRTAGFTREERDDFEKVLASGFVDTFRHFNPGKQYQYSYWGMRSGGRSKGIGWRLDYFVVSERLLPRVKASLIRAEAYGASDHVPIVLVLEDQPA